MLRDQFTYFCSSQTKSKHGTATMQMMAKDAMAEPWSNAFLKLPARE